MYFGNVKCQYVKAGQLRIRFLIFKFSFIAYTANKP